MLEPSGHCHFGHHEDPRRAFTFHAKGVLRVEDERWFLTRENDEIECLAECLIGHRSQIIVTTIPDEEALNEQIKELDSESLEGKTIDELTSKLTETRDLLTEINRLKNDIDA